MIDNLEPKPDMWEANPKLKMLSLVFIFVFLFSGIGLVIFSVWSNQYRQKIYEETQSSLPKHEVSQSAGQQISNSEIKDWKTYKNDQYGFEIRYPQEWNVPTSGNQWFELGCPKVDSEAGPRCPLLLEILKPIQKPDYIKTLQLTAFKDNNGIVNQNGPEIKSQVLDGVDVITYRDAGMCTYTQTMYFGNKQNILFTDNCELYQNNEIYSKIVETFKFTK